MCISRKFAIVGIALGALGIGYTFVVHRKVRKITKTPKEIVVNMPSAVDKQS